MKKPKDLKSLAKKYGIRLCIVLIYLIIVDLLPDNPFVLAFSLFPAVLYVIIKYDINLEG